MTDIKLKKGPCHDDGGEFPPEECYCGDVFLVGVEIVPGGEGRTVRIDWHVITATESGWDDADGETWGSWDVSDVSYWAKLPERMKS